MSEPFMIPSAAWQAGHITRRN